MAKMDDLIKENDFLKSQLIQNDMYIKKLILNLNKQFQIVEKLNKELETYEINKNKENLMLKQKILTLESELNKLKNNINDREVESCTSDSHSNNSITVFVNKIMTKLKEDNEILIKENLDLNRKVFDLNINLTKLDSQHKIESEKVAMKLDKYKFEIQRWKKKMNYYKNKHINSQNVENDNTQQLKDNDLNDLFEKIFNNENLNNVDNSNETKAVINKKISKNNLKISI